jgi:citrate lyase subunit beta/citryl-CoA lyase
MTANRTFLFAPGNHPRKVAKVFAGGADVAILDLEDAVAIAEKAATRTAVVEAMKQPRPCRGYVRVNSFDTEYCYRDLKAVIGSWLNGIVLPKTETPAQLLTVDWVMRQLEVEQGMEPGGLDLMPIIETGKGIAALDELARCGSRVKRFAFGAGDFTLDMDLQWSSDEFELADARARLVLSSRTAGLEPPIDTVVIHIRDHERFAASARRGRAMGFQGKLCIHPDQVDPCNTIFTPTVEEVEHARQVIAAFEAAEAAGSASIQLDGYFIDYPIVYKAQRVLALVEDLK